MRRIRVYYTTNGETDMIENTPMDKHIEQMTFSFMNAHDGEQMWFPWAQTEKPIDPKPRRRTKLRNKKKTKKND